MHATTTTTTTTTHTHTHTPCNNDESSSVIMLGKIDRRICREVRRQAHTQGKEVDKRRGLKEI